MLHSALTQAPREQIGGQELCTASAVDPESALAADVLPLSTSAALAARSTSTSPACKLIELDAVSKLDPTTLRWVNARTSLLTLEPDLASDRLWLTEGQAHTWLGGAKTNVVVIVGAGLDDDLLAARCGEMFHSTRARVLRGGVTTLSNEAVTVSANEALTALLHAKPHTLTLSSSDRVAPELAMRLRDSDVRVERMAPAAIQESTAVIQLHAAHSKQTLRFNIAGGTDALVAAYQQYTALALAPKIEPRRPCYFP